MDDVQAFIKKIECKKEAYRLRASGFELLISGTGSLSRIMDAVPQNDLLEDRRGF